MPTYQGRKSWYPVGHMNSFTREFLNGDWFRETLDCGDWSERYPEEVLICVACNGRIARSPLYFDASVEDTKTTWRCHDCACKEGIVW